MGRFAGLDGLVGLPQINADFVLDSTQRFAMGTLIPGLDNYWGGGEFIYCYYAGTVRQFGLVNIQPSFDSTNKRWRWDITEAASTSILGKNIGVAMLAGVAGNYGWVCVTGVVPVNCNASVAADTTFSIAAAGQGGAAATGKQIVNARIIAAGSTTVAVPVTGGPNGATYIDVSYSDGFFVGAYLSGTNVGASAKVVSISPDGKRITTDVANSGVVSGNLTATYNNATIYYNVAHINRPFQQGAIT